MTSSKRSSPPGKKAASDSLRPIPIASRMVASGGGSTPANSARVSWVQATIAAIESITVPSQSKTSRRKGDPMRDILFASLVSRIRERGLGETGLGGAGQQLVAHATARLQDHAGPEDRVLDCAALFHLRAGQQERAFDPGAAGDSRPRLEYCAFGLRCAFEYRTLGQKGPSPLRRERPVEHSFEQAPRSPEVVPAAARGQRLDRLS